jgi:EmrB/QacA subfamily drug resistance transporter
MSRPSQHRKQLHHHEPPSETADRPRSRKVLVGVLAVAQLMVILDISAVNVALPDVSADLGIARGDIGWAITSYSLVFGTLLLLGGRAADAIGRRRIFFAGLGVFTAASMMTAMALDATTLFAGRAGQGLGAAMLSPAALSIIMTSFSGAERTRALAVWGAVGGAGAAIGVLLGGVLTELVDWRAIFFINLPVGMGLVMAALKHVPRDTEPMRWTGLDLHGAAIATAGLGALVYAISQASTAGWTSAETLIVGGGGLVVLAGFAAIERRTATPLLKVERLSERAVGGGMLMMLAVSGVLFGSFLLTSIYMQEVMGTSALITGLAFLPMALAIGAGAHLGGQVVGHGGVRGPMALALGLAAGGLLMLSAVGESGDYLADLLPGMLVAGVGMGIALVSVSVSVLTGGRDDEAGMLSGLSTTGHEIGGSLGVAVLVSIATSATAGSGVASGIGDAFLAAAAIAGGAGMIALMVLPSAASFLPKLALAPRVSIH